MSTVVAGTTGAVITSAVSEAKGVLSSIAESLVEFGKELVRYVMKIVEKFIEFASRDPLKASLLVVNLIILFGG